MESSQMFGQFNICWLLCTLDETDQAQLHAMKRDEQVLKLPLAKMMLFQKRLSSTNVLLVSLGVVTLG